MSNFGQALLDGWKFREYCEWPLCARIALYLLIGVLLSLVIRAVLTALWTHEAMHTGVIKSPGGAWGKYWRRFRCKSDSSFKEDSDHWHPLVLGVLEIWVAPILVVSDAWAAIGAWLTFKTVAQWDAWKTSRHMFNRFLIGNLLLLIFAWFLARFLLAAARAAPILSYS